MRSTPAYRSLPRSRSNLGQPRREEVVRHVQSALMRPRGHTRSREMAQRDSVAAETNVGAWTRTTSGAASRHTSDSPAAHGRSGDSDLHSLILMPEPASVRRLAIEPTIVTSRRDRRGLSCFGYKAAAPDGAIEFHASDRGPVAPRAGDGATVGSGPGLLARDSRPEPLLGLTNVVADSDRHALTIEWARKLGRASGWQRSPERCCASSDRGHRSIHRIRVLSAQPASKIIAPLCSRPNQAARRRWPRWRAAHTVKSTGRHGSSMTPTRSR
jgi:hypothetical protein